MRYQREKAEMTPVCTIILLLFWREKKQTEMHVLDPLS